MGTNYYLVKAPCPHCGRSGEPLHIGKQSSDWPFCFEAHADPPIRSAAAMELYLYNAIKEHAGRIEDEYGNVFTLDELRHIWSSTRGVPTPRCGYSTDPIVSQRRHEELMKSGDEFIDPDGHRFSNRVFS